MRPKLATYSNFAVNTPHTAPLVPAEALAVAPTGGGATDSDEGAPLTAALDRGTLDVVGAAAADADKGAADGLAECDSPHAAPIKTASTPKPTPVMLVIRGLGACP